MHRERWGCPLDEKWRPENSPEIQNNFADAVEGREDQPEPVPEPQKLQPGVHHTPGGTLEQDAHQQVWDDAERRRKEEEWAKQNLPNQSDDHHLNNDDPEHDDTRKQ